MTKTPVSCAPISGGLSAAGRAVPPGREEDGTEAHRAADLPALWGAYVWTFANWRSFWTLTFSDADRTHAVTRSECEFLWRRLVQVLNRDLFGNHYSRIVGHSYFAYALSFEFQKRGVLHMHALVDAPTNWELANKIWRHMAGIIKIKPVDDAQKISVYLCKYVTKGGDVVLYRPAECKEPSFRPLWWLDALEISEVHSTD